MKAVAFGGRWLAFLLVGGISYVGGYALWATIQMGAPLFDWLWYVPLLLFLVLLLLPYCLRFSRSRYLKLVYIVLLVWLVIGYNSLTPTQTLSLEDAPSLSLSFWFPGRIEQLSEGLLNDLTDAQSTLIIHVSLPLTHENQDYLISLLNQLAAHQIPVVLFVPASDFLSLPVYREWLESVAATAMFVQSAQLPNVCGVIGDAESPREARYAFPTTTAAALQIASDEMEAFLQEFHAVNPRMPLGVTASWPLFADQLDGDSDLAAFYQTAVDPPGNWGFVSVMNYTSYYPASWRPYLLARIIWGMERLYPEQSPIHFIGIAGGGFPWEPVLTFEDAVANARLSRALGVSEVVVFQLKGALDKHGEDFVERLHAAVNETDGTITLPFSRLASLWLFGTAVLDAMFDLLVGRLWLLLVWAAINFSIIWRQERQFKRAKQNLFTDNKIP
ncbi:MAG: hypothetical protein KJ069_28185 [Anaerolineae bacterium]|nr:hypothetical protein [Anaerolineae bacterium]